MIAAPVHLSYEFAGYEEYCLSFGDPGAARKILIIPPLFDEMSRTRSMVVAAMRELVQRGVCTYWPDLPGCNESLADIAAQTLDSWREAISSAAEAFNVTHIASIRGGTLVDHNIALPHWRLAPVKGSSIVKTMLRTRMATDKECGRNSTLDSLRTAALSEPIEISGYVLSATMLTSLDEAVARPVTQLRELSLGEGKGTIAGSPLWLRAEPQSDAVMSAAIANDLDRWSASCGE